MRVEVQPDGKFEIQINWRSPDVWVLTRETALQLAAAIIELAGESDGDDSS